MIDWQTFTGQFVAEYTPSGLTEASLRDGRTSGGDAFQMHPLKFDTNIEKLLKQSGIPALYGTPTYLVYPAMVRGALSADDLHDDQMAIQNIVSVELVDDSNSCLVSYVLRLDDADLDQPYYLPSALDEGCHANDRNDPIRIPCEYLYYPATKQLTITSSMIAPAIRLPNQIVPQLLNHLPLHMADGPDGVATPIMSASGVIEGQLQMDVRDRNDVLIVPDVLTVDIGVALHRLWLARNLFRWFVDEDRVVPIP